MATWSMPTADIRPASSRSILRGKQSGITSASVPQVLGCERLANGNTLVAEQGPCRVVEVNPRGETVHVTNLHTNQAAYHLQVRNVHKLANGNILAAHEGEGAIREYEPDGRTAWEYTGVTNTGDALRLANGNTLIAGATQKRLIEVTPDRQIVWEFTAADVPSSI